MTERHTCIRCATCGSTAGCPYGDGRLCLCGLALCWDHDCPDGGEPDHPAGEAA